MRIAFIVVLAGCASEPAFTPTITQGVWGQLTSSSDVAGEPDGAYGNAAIAAYAADGSQLLASTSDGSGFFELALAPGTYTVCTLDAQPATLADQWQHNCAGKCTSLDVPAGRIRADWAANLSGGWWATGDHCPH